MIELETITAKDNSLSGGPAPSSSRGSRTVPLLLCATLPGPLTPATAHRLQVAAAELHGYFTNINGAETTGTVNFVTPLAPGQTTWFSLEEALSGADINVVTATASSISAVEGNALSGTAL